MMEANTARFHISIRHSLSSNSFLVLSFFSDPEGNTLYPTLPSKLILSSFCASMANSMGSFFNTSFA